MVGNTDFPSLVKKKIQKAAPEHFQSAAKEDVAVLQTCTMQTWDDLHVIRHIKCAILLLEKDRCSMCVGYRKSLFAMVSRQKTSCDEKEKSKVNDRYQSRTELIEKLKHLEKEKRALVAKCVRLQEKVKKLIKLDGVAVDIETNDVLVETMTREVITNPFDIESPQYLLWEQQKLQATKKDSRAMVWHPLIIRWCLSIYLKSPGTYKHIRNSPFMFLPSKNTLLKYVNFTDPGCGFNVDIISRLISSVKFDEMKSDSERNVSLLFDEMRIKSGLVFCRSTGKLVGFTEMGDINDALDEFKRKCQGDISADNNPDLAKYVIVFMVRGILSKLCYAFGHFASEGFTSDQLYPCVWEAIRILESIGLKVRAVVSDGASPNRKFYRLHKMFAEDNVEDGVVFWTLNKWCPGNNLLMFKFAQGLGRILQAFYIQFHIHIFLKYFNEIKMLFLSLYQKPCNNTQSLFSFNTTTSNFIIKNSNSPAYANVSDLRIKCTVSYLGKIFMKN